MWSEKILPNGKLLKSTFSILDFLDKVIFIFYLIKAKLQINFEVILYYKKNENTFDRWYGFYREKACEIFFK